MINLNFYCDKDFSLKSIYSPKVFLWTIALSCFLSIGLRAQSVRFKAPTSTDLQYQLDSVQPYTTLSLHGIYVPVNARNSHAQAIRFVNRTVLRFRYNANDINLQAGLKLNTPLKEMDTLYVYGPKGLVDVLHLNNQPKDYWLSEPSSDSMIIELVTHEESAPQIEIEEILLSPINRALAKTSDFGDSESCQVNTACSERAGYENQIGSVVRILVRINNLAGWCSGTLLNNTSYTYEPFILSAEHCGLFNNNFASATDLNRWVFYFNYQSPTCANPANEGSLANQQLTGATLLARSDDEGGETGSDLLLVELNNAIPFSSVYYAGWNRSTNNPQNGVGIHHPAGDLKKISTMQGTAINGAFGTNANSTHWLVNWAPTANGFGTTEEGSSGSPIFDENGLVTGMLTGGASSCSNTSGLDYYGKFSYGWRSNGSAANRQLQPWLDPTNTGVLALPGAYFGDQPPADTTTIDFGPNPTSGLIYFNGLGSVSEPAQIDVYSLGGKLVFSNQQIILPNTSLEIDLSNQSNGVYLINIETAEQNHRYKVILQN
jgi:hypothetical protein